LLFSDPWGPFTPIVGDRGRPKLPQAALTAREPETSSIHLFNDARPQPVPAQRQDWRLDSDPADPRTDDITGDLTPEWGLHLVDANIAMGNLIDVVGAQIATYTGD
jgi:hypothetical protein